MRTMLVAVSVRIAAQILLNVSHLIVVLNGPDEPHEAFLCLAVRHVKFREHRNPCEPLFTGSSEKTIFCVVTKQKAGIGLTFSLFHKYIFMKIAKKVSSSYRESSTLAYLV